MKKLVTTACFGLLLAGFAKIVAAQSGLSISPTTLPDGTAGTPYLGTLTPNGGSGVGYQFSITSGEASLTALGLSFSAATRVISGTPTAGVANFTVQLTDSTSDTTSQAYTISVNTVAVLYSFAGASDGDEPTMIIQAQDGSFYGITSFGGGLGNCSTDGCGTIFKLVNTGSTWTEISPPLHSFSGGPDGGIPSSLIQAPGGNMFVTTLIGGPDSIKLDICQAADGSSAPCCLDLNDNPVTCGAIFEFNPTQSAPVTLNPIYTFSGGTDGAYPGTLILGSTGSNPKSIFGTTLACSNCSFSVDDAGFETFGTIFSFGPLGSNPVTPTTIVPLLSSNTSLAYPNSLIQWDLNTLYGTTQMGGDSSSTAPCPFNGFGGFGCGGVFEVVPSTNSILELCDFGGEGACADSPSIQGATSPKHIDASRGISPEKTVIRQSGIRFPVGGSTWSYSIVPMALVMDSSGNIYGTTPPGCADGNNYSADPDCPITSNSPSAETSSVYEFTPPGSSSSNGTMDSLLYPFSGNNTANPLPPTPGGTIAGLTLATDNNFYGLSGDGLTQSELFTVQSSGITQIASFDPSYTPTWMIQGNDGNFYGTSPAGGTNGFGAVFEVLPANPLPSPVQLSFTSPQITLGKSAKLTWRVPNAFSLSSELCFPFVQSSESGAGTWSEPGIGSVSSGVFRNSASITPTEPGTYNYAVTCGGIISGFATLQVDLAALTISPAKLPAGTAKASYSEVLTASGGSAKGYDFSITSGADSLISLGLNLTPAGLISGTPTAGTASFTIQLTDSLGDSTSQAYTLVVNKALPTINWPPPPTITYGTLITATQEDASANVAGTFSYVQPIGWKPIAGTHTMTVTFTPTDTTDYKTATATVTLTVNQATPTIGWANPAAITYGTALNSTQLDATSKVAGTFVYSPSAGAVLTAGSQTLSVTLTPTDTTDYTTATATVTLTVNKAAPIINWQTPEPITYGTAVGPTQQDASANVAGTFSYVQPNGWKPIAGTHTMTVTFTPTNTTDYKTATATVTLTVDQATPTTTWAKPAAIAYGMALSAKQLDATSRVAGTFVYSPIAGTVLTAGTQTLSVTFTPTDSTDYTTAAATVTLTVNKAAPIITWQTPEPITYGTAVGPTQQDATANVPGSFAYSQKAGWVPIVGTHTMTVTFTPTDTLDYKTVTAAVTLTVNPAT